MGNYGGSEAKVVLKAEAGNDQVVASTTTVTLDGSWSSYPNGVTTFTFSWSQTEGETVSIDNATELEAKFTPTKEGVYVFKLTITADGNTSSDEVTVWVERDSFPPYQAIDFGGKTYTDITYDKNGNMVTIGGRQMAYDYENRPTTILMPTETGKVITYTYDYTGQRVKKEVRDKDKQEQKLTQQAEKLDAAGKTRLAEAIEKAILQLAMRKKPTPPKPGPGPKPSQTEVTYYIGNLYEVNSSSTTTIVTKYIYANGQRVVSVKQENGSRATGYGTLSFYHSDHLGSSNIITDSLGNKVQLLEYIPFGETRLSQGNADVSYRFTGQMLDNDAGLYYYGARWYEPVIGKFITPDSLIQAPYDPQSLNRYAYCRNNPVMYVDPTGHTIWSDFWGGFENIIQSVLADWNKDIDKFLYEDLGLPSNVNINAGVRKEWSWGDKGGSSSGGGNSTGNPGIVEGTPPTNQVLAMAEFYGFEPADIFLYYHRGLPGGKIILKTGGDPYAHAALYMGEGWVEESTVWGFLKGGVRIRPLTINETVDMDVFRYKGGLSKGQQESIVGYARLQLGKGYDWLGLITAGWRADRTGEKRMVCSELIRLAYEKGPQIKPYNLSPIYLTPGDPFASPNDLYRSPYLEKVWGW